MFVRVKPSGKYQYLQVVKNYREGAKVKQKVIGTLGRLDRLLESGTLEKLSQSMLRFSQRLRVVSAHQAGELQAKQVVSIGPGLVFDRLWERMGLKQILTQLLGQRKFNFSVERAIFLTVLHRLFAPGSDREADKWKEDFRIEGVEELRLHHLYRAMAWLGEELPEEEQEGANPFAPRCTKDVIEERLFEQHRDLFSSLELVFFDTTSMYFEGEGGESLGQRGNSKDHRPDLKQMVVGAVLDGDGRPICCELWPGNTADVETLIPTIERLKRRFGIQSVCIVADRGMISKKTIQKLESYQPPISYILGVRMRKLKEVREEVLADEGEYREIFPERQTSRDPSPLKVKEVQVEGRRYIECYNADQARKDAATRRAILEALEEKLKKGDKVLVGNKGYRRYLKTPEEGSHFMINEEKAKEEERFDGLWVSRTSTDLAAEEVALKYKELWMVESIFRSVKSILKTRPVYHKYDATIRGHVFCSFLSLVLAKELQSQMEAKNHKLEWKDLLRDLERLQEVEVKFGSQTFFLRTELKGNCIEVIRAAGVKIPPAVRQ
jgi:transposase